MLGISCFLLLFLLPLALTDNTEFSTFIRATNCELFYTIEDATFTFNNCRVSTVTETSWLRCIAGCCRNMPGSDYSTPSLQGLADCKTSTEQN